jgi:hypothetical protein
MTGERQKYETKNYTVGLVLISIIGMTAHAEQLIFPYLRPESQSNIIVTADPEHRISCPPEYANLLSNTNLFSAAEVQQLKAIPLKYKNITTNSGPAGTIFNGLAKRQWIAELGYGNAIGTAITIFQVSCFAYTNSAAWEEISFTSYMGAIVNFRTESGDGYNVQLINGRVIRYEEYKNGVLDGLNESQGFDEDHCTTWSRFVKGKIVGKFIAWNEGGDIFAEAEFKEPFDFLKYCVGQGDMSLEKIPTIHTNAVGEKGYFKTVIDPETGQYVIVNLDKQTVTSKDKNDNVLWAVNVPRSESALGLPFGDIQNLLVDKKTLVLWVQAGKSSLVVDVHTGKVTRGAIH